MIEQQAKFPDQLRSATTFPEIVAVVRAELEKQVLTLDALIRKRNAVANSQRPGWLRDRRKVQSQLRSLDSMLERHQSLQANRKIPIALRKRLRDTEIELLRFEYDTGLGDFARGVARARKKQLAELLDEADRYLNSPMRFSVVNPAFPVGKDFPASAITKAYDKHVWAVLRSHFETTPRIKGQPQRWRVMASLPERSEYLRHKERHYTRILESLVEVAYSIIGELQGELNGVLEDMSESARETERAVGIEEIAQELEAIAGDVPTVPPCIASLQVVHYPAASRNGNSARAHEAAALLSRVADVVGSHLTSGAKLKKAEASEVDAFRKQIREHISQIESLDL